MKNNIAYLSLFILFFAVIMSCKKSNDKSNTNTNTTNTFADSLRKTCTRPFVGPADSSNFYLPTAFTPNGDGLDDVYNMIGYRSDSDFSSFLMTIYDTTGTLVFQTNSATRAWDGTDTTTGKQSTKYKFYVEIAYTTIGNKSVSAGTFLFLLSTNTTGCINIVKSDSSGYEFPDQFNPITGFDPAISSQEIFCN